MRDPETKRKIIGREFIRSFESAARQIAGDQGMDFLIQGTLYPDVVESGNFYYSTRSEILNPVSMGVVITHFNRQQYVLPALERLKSEFVGFLF